MKIIEGYILLGGADFLSVHASGVAKIFDGVVANVNQKGLLSAMPIIEMLVQVSLFLGHPFPCFGVF